MPGIRGNRPKRPPTRRPVLATRTPLAQARGRAGKGPKSAKIGACCRRARFNAVNSEADPVPDCPSRRIMADRVAARAWSLIVAAAWPPAAWRLRRGDGETHYVPAGGVAARRMPVSIKAVFDGLAMKDDQGKGAEKTGADVKDSRRDRLKLALRENLKRRKSQARGRSDAGASSENADASLDDASGEKPEPVARGKSRSLAGRPGMLSARF